MQFVSIRLIQRLHINVFLIPEGDIFPDNQGLFLVQGFSTLSNYFSYLDKTMSDEFKAAPSGYNATPFANGNANAVTGSKNEYLYKILVIGELGTGKTSLIKQYVHKFFSQHYRATIGKF